MGPYARILLRYASAALVTWGAVSPETGDLMAHDKDLEQVTVMVLGLGVAAAVELYYRFAKRWDWPT